MYKILASLLNKKAFDSIDFLQSCCDHCMRFFTILPSIFVIYTSNIFIHIVESLINAFKLISVLNTFISIQETVFEPARMKELLHGYWRVTGHIGPESQYWCEGLARLKCLVMRWWTCNLFFTFFPSLKWYDRSRSDVESKPYFDASKVLGFT